MTVPETTPDADTTAEDEHDAHAAHVSDRAPTPEEEWAADANPPIPAESAQAYEEAIELGAAVKGEGQIDPA
jgi:hypothetical protein